MNRLNIVEFFSKYPNVVVAFSGGVDSAVLLSMALKYSKSVKVIFVKTEFQPEFELEDAKKFCDSQGIKLNVIYVNILDIDTITVNNPLRCYYCKKMIFDRICNLAGEDEVVIDGTNADDDVNERPGYKALQELGVLSPLRICGFTKKMIRDYAKNNLISLWNKPSYSCLATRIPVYTKITENNLNLTDKSEQVLFNLGFTDFRVRYAGEKCFVEINEKEFEKMIVNKDKVRIALNDFYDKIYLDLKGR